MACFYVTIKGYFQCFQYLTLEQVVWKTKTSIKKLEYHFSIESTAIENATFPFRTALSKANIKGNRMRCAKWTDDKKNGVCSFTPTCWFSLNNSETVKAVTPAFCSIQQHFMRDILARFGIPNLPQSPDTGQNLDEGISDFRISGQSLIKENCYYS